MRKLTVELDLTELYDEYDGDYGESATVSEMITGEIKGELRKHLSSIVRDKISKEYEEEVEDFLKNEDLLGKIKKRIFHNVEVGTFNLGTGYRSKTIDETIADLVENGLSTYAKDEMKKYVNNAFDEVKEVYNKEFAVGILTKLNENNYLTSEAQNILFANIKK